MQKLYLSPIIFSSFSNVVSAETMRHGGVSPAPFASLNLGNFTDDKAENINENRKLVLSEMGFSSDTLTFSKQVHDNKVLLATKSGAYDGYDAIISNTKGLVLAVTIADCTPILIYDAKNQAIAAVHAGWKGTVLQIVSETLAAMKTHFGTKGKHCFAYIGTCIDECDFEVGEDVASQFDEQFKVFYGNKNKFHIKMKEANRTQLLDFGIPSEQIEISPFSTASNCQNYFSHRAEKGLTGRMMALIALKS